MQSRSIYSTTQQPPNISFTILNNDTTTSRIEGHSSTSSIITGALISGVLLLLLAGCGVLFLVCVLRAKASRREGTDQSEEIHQEKKKNEAYICAGKEGQIVRPKQVHGVWGLILYNYYRKWFTPKEMKHMTTSVTDMVRTQAGLEETDIHNTIQERDVLLDRPRRDRKEVP